MFLMPIEKNVIDMYPDFQCNKSEKRTKTDLNYI